MKESVYIGPFSFLGKTRPNIMEGEEVEITRVTDLGIPSGPWPGHMFV